MPRFNTLGLRIANLFRLFKVAISGSEKEFTTGNINRAIFLLAVPMILEMLMESLFAVVDIYFVSHLGVDAITTVGLTESILTIVYTLAMGLSIAATAVIARRVGEKNTEAASHAAIQVLYLGLVISVLITMIGIFFSKDILMLMGASPGIVNNGYEYTALLLQGNIVIILLFLINGIFRGAGDAALAMRALWLANGLNILLCPILINGWGIIPAFGLKGAALATFIGRGTGVCYQLFHLLKGKDLIRITRKQLGLAMDVIWSLLRIAGGATGQMLIASASWIFLVRIISRFGTDAVAGYTIGIRIMIFTLLPAWGMANAASALVGQNLGAGQPDRAEVSVWKTAFYNMLFLGCMALLFWIAAPTILKLFTDQPEVIGYGVQCLRYISMGFLFYAYGMVLMQSFNGAGDTRTPLFINLIALWLWQMPLSWFLAVYCNMGPEGVFLGVAISESTSAIIAICLFRRNTWKLVKI
ncbi:MATE family efflux transporter [Chitinophaga silvatica]|uniref:Multidrug-efflux transporter n=1 Tax=Chitinophaga silvatica TaxID=2282649 RepID=A0A3E1Y9J8_9BACT|nr:MATE family efflux transporter [Chitinophaga silvatica]RFS22369.1 MATE family efflux transporter [Chitinophaga silvatica]